MARSHLLLVLKMFVVKYLIC